MTTTATTTHALRIAPPFLLVDSIIASLVLTKLLLHQGFGLVIVVAEVEFGSGHRRRRDVPARGAAPVVAERRARDHFGLCRCWRALGALDADHSPAAAGDARQFTEKAGSIRIATSGSRRRAISMISGRLTQSSHDCTAQTGHTT